MRQPAPELPAPLAAALEQLIQHPQVVGVLSIGSLAANILTPASDYDLVVVLATCDVPWYVGVGTIGGRFTDLLFVAQATLDELIATAAPIAHDDVRAPVLRWLADGTILSDRSGLIRRAQEVARQAGMLLPPYRSAAYAAWFGLNYNFAVLLRLWTAPDPLYRQVALIRMAVYGSHDFWFGYFQIRSIPWAGDKAAVQYLSVHDPDYLQRFQHWLGETEPEARLQHYRILAAQAAAPFGGLWPPGWSGENRIEPPLRVCDLLVALVLDRRP